MKKQIVLSLSVLMLAISNEVFAPAKGRAPREEINRNINPSVIPPVNPPASSATLTSAQAVANSNVTLADVKAALDGMGDLGNSTPEGTKKAKDFITTGSASASSSNHSHKLGRLSRK